MIVGIGGAAAALAENTRRDERKERLRGLAILVLQQRENRIRELAYRMWEDAGKPEVTEEEPKAEEEEKPEPSKSDSKAEARKAKAEKIMALRNGEKEGAEKTPPKPKKPSLLQKVASALHV